MTLGPGARKLALTAHVATSVGWLGAVVAFLALSMAGMTSDDVQTVRSVYIAMNVIGAFIIVPLSIAALVTGLIQALGTQWGLFKYYWVATKFVLSIVATTLLLLHQFTAVAEAARRAAASAPEMLPDVARLDVQLAVDAGAAVILLLVTTILSIYKPWGRTSYGRRAQVQDDGLLSGIATAAAAGSTPIGFRIFLVIIGAIVTGILIVHLAGGGLGHH